MAKIVPTNPLDAWAQTNFKKMASKLKGDEMEDLITHILTLSKDDVDFWEPRDERMLDSQRYWELWKRKTIEKEGGMSEDNEDTTQKSAVEEFNDGYLIIDKLVSMVSGATWGFDVPPKSQENEAVAQKIENFLRFVDRELEQQNALALEDTSVRGKAHWAALRGWITGLIVPDPSNPEFPWEEILEDPLCVYPRYSRKKLIRVTHKYDITALQARADYPGTYEWLSSVDDDTELALTCYYDEKYKISIVSHSTEPNPSISGRQVVIPLVEHGYMDMNGNPINPWIIVAPRGTPTRRSNGLNKEDSIALIGLDAIYPIKRIIERLERVAAQMSTEIDKGVNPPRIIFYDGINTPAPLDLAPGTDNFMIMGQQDMKVVETTAVKPDTGPYLQMLTERLQKGSIPGTLFGEGSGSMAGYAINLLNSSARDILEPLLKGIKTYQELRYRRVLEMYYNIGSMVNDEFSFFSRKDNDSSVYSGYETLTPDEISMNGVFVDVTFEDILPQNLLQMLPAVVGAVQSKILPLYDAMKMIGVKDPHQAMRRLAEGDLYSDPMIMKHLVKLAAMRTGNPDLQLAVLLAQEEAQMMMQMQQMSGQQNPQIPVDPTMAGAPQRGDPNVNMDNQMDINQSAVDVENGATPPAAESDAEVQNFLQSIGGG